AISGPRSGRRDQVVDRIRGRSALRGRDRGPCGPAPAGLARHLGGSEPRRDQVHPPPVHPALTWGSSEIGSGEIRAIVLMKDGMTRDTVPSSERGRDLLSSSADLVRAGSSTVELEEAPGDDRNGT